MIMTQKNREEKHVLIVIEYLIKLRSTVPLKNKIARIKKESFEKNSSKRKPVLFEKVDCMEFVTKILKNFLELKKK